MTTETHFINLPKHTNSRNNEDDSKWIQENIGIVCASSVAAKWRA